MTLIAKLFTMKKKEGLDAFCRIMNMPSLSKPGYYKQVDNIQNARKALYGKERV